MHASSVCVLKHLVDSIHWEEQQQSQHAEHEGRVHCRSIQLQVQAVVAEQGSTGGHHTAENRRRLQSHDRLRSASQQPAVFYGKTSERSSILLQSQSPTQAMES